MHDCVNSVSTEYFHHEIPIAHLSNDKRRIENRLPEARGQIVQHHHLLTASPKLQYDVASDVTGPAGD
jgi:hypothetical protein